MRPWLSTMSSVTAVSLTSVSSASKASSCRDLRPSSTGTRLIMVRAPHTGQALSLAPLSVALNAPHSRQNGSSSVLIIWDLPRDLRERKSLKFARAHLTQAHCGDYRAKTSQDSASRAAGSEDEESDEDNQCD